MRDNGGERALGKEDGPPRCRRLRQLSFWCGDWTNPRHAVSYGARLTCHASGTPVHAMIPMHTSCVQGRGDDQRDGVSTMTGWQWSAGLLSPSSRRKASQTATSLPCRALHGMCTKTGLCKKQKEINSSAAP